MCGCQKEKLGKGREKGRAHRSARLLVRSVCYVGTHRVSVLGRKVLSKCSKKEVLRVDYPRFGRSERRGVCGCQKEKLGKGEKGEHIAAHG